jgi:hypothetical protein
VEDVAREMHLPFSNSPINHRLEMVQSDTCYVDCAGLTFTSQDGLYNVTVYLIAFSDETQASDLRLFMHNEAIANDATGVPLPDGAWLDGLPEGASVFYLDRVWLALARHNRVFLSIEIVLKVAPDASIPADDIVTLGLVAARLTALQALALEDVGY